MNSSCAKMCNSYVRNNQSVESSPPFIDMVGERSVFTSRASKVFALPSGPMADSRALIGDADACRHSEPLSEWTAQRRGMSILSAMH